MVILSTGKANTTQYDRNGLYWSTRKNCASIVNEFIITEIIDSSKQSEVHIFDTIGLKGLIMTNKYFFYMRNQRQSVGLHSRL